MPSMQSAQYVQNCQCTVSSPVYLPHWLAVTSSSKSPTYYARGSRGFIKGGIPLMKPRDPVAYPYIIKTPGIKSLYISRTFLWGHFSQDKGYPLHILDIIKITWMSGCQIYIGQSWNILAGPRFLYHFQLGCLKFRIRRWSKCCLLPCLAISSFEVKCTCTYTHIISQHLPCWALGTCQLYYISRLVLVK